MKRIGMVAGAYLVLAIFVIGLGYALFTLFAPTSSSHVSHWQQEHPKGDNKEGVDRVSPTHAVQTATTAKPWGIAFDALHLMVWVAEPGCEPTPTCLTPVPGVLGQYDLLDGSWIQDFPEPPGYTRPAFVALDANGKVWFTDFDANTIDFFNPHTDKLVENPIPTPDSNPYGITRDARGTIWFTENRLGVGQIGGFTPTPSGRVALVEHQVTTAEPHLITSDKQGHIWYSEAFGGSIGEYTPASGRSVDYPVSSGICAREAVCKTHISGISVDTQGDIWFSDSEFELVGYLIPSTGHVVTKTVSNQDDNAYDGLGVDGYNNVWFTEPYSSLLVLWPKKTVK